MRYARANDMVFVMLLARALGAGYDNTLARSMYPRGSVPISLGTVLGDRRSPRSVRSTVVRSRHGTSSRS